MGSTSGPDFDVAIVGGGIAGLCLALSIVSHTSIPVTVYEAASKFGEIGAGLAFGPNAVRAMSLISDELYEKFKSGATFNLSPEKKHIFFDFRLGMDGENEAARSRGVNSGVYLSSTEHPEPYSGMINRSHFVDELVKLLPQDAARLGKTLVDIDDKGVDGVILRFKDNTEAKHSAVIACDGIHSKIRKIIFGEDNPASYPMFTGKYCYRGMIPMATAVDRLGSELAMNCQVYLGYHGHLLTFPVAGGNMMNVVAFNSTREWVHDKTVIPATKEQMQKDFEGWGPEVKSIIDMTGKSDIWALFDHPPVPSYVKGRLCLLGDAAHASTPFQGAGAGMAVEDAYVLARILRETKTASQLPAAFLAYDSVRRERTQKLVTTSREAGYVLHFELVGDDLPKIKQALKGRMDWIWNHDFEAEVSRALANMNQ